MCFVRDVLRLLGPCPYWEAQLKAMAATETGSVGASGVTPLTLNQADCDALAELSLHDRSYDQIAEVLLRRMKNTAKWGRALKALMVLDHCVRKGSPRFKTFCRSNEDLIRTLELLPYVLSDLLGVHTDPGVEARCAGKRLGRLLAEPSFGHVNTTTPPRGRSPAHAQEKAARYSGRGYRPLDPSIVLTSNLNELLEGNASGDAIITVARETRSPDAYIDIVHCVLHSFVTAADATDRPSEAACTVSLLLKECLVDISSEVSQYFERPIMGRSHILPLLRSLDGLGGAELLSCAEYALCVVDIQRRAFQAVKSATRVLKVTNEPKPRDREYTLLDFMDDASRISLDTDLPPYAPTT